MWPLGYHMVLPLTFPKLKHIHRLVGEGPLPAQPADHSIDIRRGRTQLLELAFGEDEARPFTNRNHPPPACLPGIGAGRRGNPRQGPPPGPALPPPPPPTPTTC